MNIQDDLGYNLHIYVLLIFIVKIIYLSLQLYLLRVVLQTYFSLQVLRLLIIILLSCSHPMPTTPVFTVDLLRSTIDACISLIPVFELCHREVQYQRSVRNFNIMCLAHRFYLPCITVYMQVHIFYCIQQYSSRNSDNFS